MTLLYLTDCDLYDEGQVNSANEFSNCSDYLFLKCD